jgi:cation:H+ antiporter
MDSLLALGSIAGGLVALVLGAELLVRGASKLALMAGITPLVIGLTIVAFGTSAPELAVSVRASLAGAADVAVGNVVGSNIFNVLLILGVSALITPLVVARQLVRFDLPVMLLVSLLAVAFAWDGHVSRLEGGLFLGALAVYLGTLYVLSRREQAQTAGDSPVRDALPGWKSLPVFLLLIGVGLVFLVLGARFLVDGAVGLAQRMGVSDVVIGLTIVAAGTSLPEVATSVVASIRGERDIAVGNVVGSNIFNILAVLGAAACVNPAGVEAAANVVTFHLPVMTAVAILCLPIFVSGAQISRWEGALFLLLYVAYTALTVLTAYGRGPETGLGPIFAFGVLPGAVVLAALPVALAWNRGRLSHSGKNPTDM